MVGCVVYKNLVYCEVLIRITQIRSLSLDLAQNHIQ